MVIFIYSRLALVRVRIIFAYCIILEYGQTKYEFLHRTDCIIIYFTSGDGRTARLSMTWYITPFPSYLTTPYWIFLS